MAPNLVVIVVAEPVGVPVAVFFGHAFGKVQAVRRHWGDDGKRPAGQGLERKILELAQLIWWLGSAEVCLGYIAIHNS
jgi:hypothetical protein